MECKIMIFNTESGSISIANYIYRQWCLTFNITIKIQLELVNKLIL